MRDRAERAHQAKVIDDNGLIRSRVPCPILKALRARPGDHLVFSLAEADKAIVRVARGRRKAGRDGSRKAVAGKRR